MKILKRGLQKDASGFVRLICEEDEDMWHVFNLIRFFVLFGIFLIYFF